MLRPYRPPCLLLLLLLLLEPSSTVVLGHGQVARLLLLPPLELSRLLIQASLAELAFVGDSHDPADSALRLAAEAELGVFQVELCVARLTERVPGRCVVVALAADAEAVPRVDRLHAFGTVWFERVLSIRSPPPFLALGRPERLNLAEDVEVLVGAHLAVRVSQVRPVLYGVDVGADFAAPLTLVKRYLLFRGNFRRRRLLLASFRGIRGSRIRLIQTVLRPDVSCPLRLPVCLSGLDGGRAS